MYVQVKAVPSELLCPSSSHPERMSGRDEERFHPERLYCYRGLRDTKKLPAGAQAYLSAAMGILLRNAEIIFCYLNKIHSIGSQIGTLPVSQDRTCKGIGVMEGKADRRGGKGHVLDISFRRKADPFILLDKQKRSLCIPCVERNFWFYTVLFQELFGYGPCILLRKMQNEFFVSKPGQIHLG